MGRTIVKDDTTRNVRPSTEGAGTGEQRTADDYKERLLKYIPAEAVALYLTVAGIITSSFDDADDKKLFLGLLLLFGIAFTPLYLWRVTNVSSKVQLGLSTVAFVVWVFAIGGWFATMDWYEASVASIVLVLVTACIPIIVPKDAQPVA